MGTLEVIEKNQLRLKKTVDRIREVLAENAAKPVGKTIGLNIIPELRERLMRQVSIWEGNSYRQVVQACISLGLERMEECGRLIEKDPPKPEEPPEQSIRSEIQRFTMETRYDKDLVEEPTDLFEEEEEEDDLLYPDEGEEG